MKYAKKTFSIFLIFFTNLLLVYYIKETYMDGTTSQQKLEAHWQNVFDLCRDKDISQKMNGTMKRWLRGPLNHLKNCYGFPILFDLAFREHEKLGALFAQLGSGFGNSLHSLATAFADAITFDREFKLITDSGLLSFLTNNMLEPNCFAYPYIDWRASSSDIQVRKDHYQYYGDTGYFGMCVERKPNLETKLVAVGLPDTRICPFEGNDLIREIVRFTLNKAERKGSTYYNILSGCVLSGLFNPSMYMLSKLCELANSVKNFENRPLISIHLRVGDKMSLPKQIYNKNDPVLSLWSFDDRIPSFDGFLNRSLEIIKSKFGSGNFCNISTHLRPILHIGTDNSELVLPTMHQWAGKNCFELLLVPGSDVLTPYINKLIEIADSKISYEKVLLDWWIMYSSDLLIRSPSTYSSTASSAKQDNNEGIIWAGGSTDHLYRKILEI